MKYFAHFVFWAKMVLIKAENEFSSVSKFVEPAIAVLNVIKKAIDTPGASVVATIIDGITNLPIATEVRTWLDKAIPEAIIALQIEDLKPKLVDPTDASKGTVELTIEDYIGSLAEYLQSSPAPIRNKILLAIASLMVKASHEAMTESEADIIVQTAYTLAKNDIPATVAATQTAAATTATK